jgi:hypothetical protein
VSKATHKPEQTVAEAECTIAALEQKQAVLNKQREADDAERSRIAFAAHAHSDTEAVKQLAELTERAQQLERQRVADYYARLSREQEERENSEARERFAASQRRSSV